MSSDNQLTLIAPFHNWNDSSRDPKTPKRSKGADDLEVLVDEDVVRPVDPDVVDVVLAVAQLHDTVDDAPWVGGQRRFRRFIRRCSADDRPRPLTPVGRDLTDLL